MQKCTTKKRIPSLFNNRRDKVIIISEIIMLLRTPASKTRVMFKCNLSFEQTNKYITFLLSIKMIEKNKSADYLKYQSTLKGLDFAFKQQQILRMLT